MTTGNRLLPLEQELDAVASRRVRRLMIFEIVLTVLAVATLILAAVVGAHRTGVKHHHSVSGWVVFVLAIAVPLILMVSGLGWLLRRPTYRTVMRYSWRERVRVTKVLRKGRPLRPQDQPIAKALVDVSRRQRWLPVVILVMACALAIVTLVPALTASRGDHRWFAIGATIFYLGVAPIPILQRRRMIDNFDRQQVTSSTADAG